MLVRIQLEVQKYNIMKTLVVDSSYMARSIIEATRAFTIFYKGNAEIVESHDEPFGLVDKDLVIMKPSIIRVYSYVNAPIHKVSLTRENLFKRDGYQCVYCGESNRKVLTVDHVVPQSKGGPNTWGNLVTACRSCNCEKADLSVKEFDKGNPEPKRPHYLMLMKNVDKIYDEWKPYLFL